MLVGCVSFRIWSLINDRNSLPLNVRVNSNNSLRNLDEKSYIIKLIKIIIKKFVQK